MNGLPNSVAEERLAIDQAEDRREGRKDEQPNDAYEIRLDENRIITGKEYDGGVKYRIENGRAATLITLSCEAVCAMFKIMRAIKCECEGSENEQTH